MAPETPSALGLSAFNSNGDCHPGYCRICNTDLAICLFNYNDRQGELWGFL